jgi:superfamily II DNA or RNA helicase
MIEWFDYQQEALDKAALQPGPVQRRCLYYKTGAGKSLLSLEMVKRWGHGAAVVITPPSTFPQWEEAAKQIGIKVECMSHAKFRMKDTKMSRVLPVIADEFHLFGAHGGKGFAKLQRFARGLQAPMVLASATPNYNDADRVYCIQSILDPRSTAGGFLQFLYANCLTQQNPFGMTPLVSKEQPFLHYANAAEYLAALPNVDYLPDDLVYTIEDVDVPVTPFVDNSFYVYGLNERKGRLVASQMEERHAIVDLSLVDDSGEVWHHILNRVMQVVNLADTPVLVFAAHATVAEALARSLYNHSGVRFNLITGDTSKKDKAERIKFFNEGGIDVLIGTASLATGTDGLDKVCDTLFILDDTDDDALRRQLIGRIMPRGKDTDASKKFVYRLVLQ